MSCSMRRRRRLRGCRYVWCAPLVRCLHSKTRVVVSTVPKTCQKNLQNFASVQRRSSIGKRPMALLPRARGPFLACRPRVVADTDDDVLILSSDLESLPSLPAPPELEQLPAAFLLRDYVAYFMTGERLMERLRTSDGRLTAINVEWDGPPESAELGSAVAAVELRFSNGMATTPWYQIDGLTSEDVEAVAAEVSQAAEWLGQMGEEVQQHDAEALRLLEKHASCKLTAVEALLLQQSKLCCPICLADFQRNHSILCLPCGRKPRRAGPVLRVPRPLCAYQMPARRVQETLSMPALPYAASNAAGAGGLYTRRPQPRVPQDGGEARGKGGIADGRRRWRRRRDGGRGFSERYGGGGPLFVVGRLLEYE